MDVPLQGLVDAIKSSTEDVALETLARYESALDQQWSDDCRCHMRHCIILAACARMYVLAARLLAKTLSSPINFLFSFCTPSYRAAVDLDDADLLELYETFAASTNDTPKQKTYARLAHAHFYACITGASRVAQWIRANLAHLCPDSDLQISSALRVHESQAPLFAAIFNKDLSEFDRALSDACQRHGTTPDVFLHRNPYPMSKICPLFEAASGDADVFIHVMTRAGMLGADALTFAPSMLHDTSGRNDVSVASLCWSIRSDAVTYDIFRRIVTAAPAAAVRERVLKIPPGFLLTQRTRDSIGLRLLLDAVDACNLRLVTLFLDVFLPTPDEVADPARRSDALNARASAAALALHYLCTDPDAGGVDAQSAATKHDAGAVFDLLLSAAAHGATRESLWTDSAARERVRALTDGWDWYRWRAPHLAARVWERELYTALALFPCTQADCECRGCDGGGGRAHAISLASVVPKPRAVSGSYGNGNGSGQVQALSGVLHLPVYALDWTRIEHPAFPAYEQTPWDKNETADIRRARMLQRQPSPLHSSGAQRQQQQQPLARTWANAALPCFVPAPPPLLPLPPLVQRLRDASADTSRDNGSINGDHGRCALCLSVNSILCAPEQGGCVALRCRDDVEMSAFLRRFITATLQQKHDRAESNTDPDTGGGGGGGGGGLEKNLNLLFGGSTIPLSYMSMPCSLAVLLDAAATHLTPEDRLALSFPQSHGLIVTHYESYVWSARRAVCMRLWHAHATAAAAAVAASGADAGAGASLELPGLPLTMLRGWCLDALYGNRPSLARLTFELSGQSPTDFACGIARKRYVSPLACLRVYPYPSSSGEMAIVAADAEARVLEAAELLTQALTVIAADANANADADADADTGTGASTAPRGDAALGEGDAAGAVQRSWVLRHDAYTRRGLQGSATPLEAALVMQSQSLVCAAALVQRLLREGEDYRVSARAVYAAREPELRARLWPRACVRRLTPKGVATPLHCIIATASFAWVGCGRGVAEALRRCIEAVRDSEGLRAQRKAAVKAAAVAKAAAAAAEAAEAASEAAAEKVAAKAAARGGQA